jgi:hypothetical protein
MAVKVATLTLLNATISGMEPDNAKAFRKNWDLDRVCAELRTRSVVDALETQLDIYDEWDAMEEAQMLRRDEYVASSIQPT